MMPNNPLLKIPRLYFKLSFILLFLHRREDYRLADGFVHDKSEEAFAHTNAKRRRHAILQSFDKIFVYHQSFTIASRTKFHLFKKSVFLINGIIKFCKSIV